MARHQIRRLPVVENGQLVGMLSLGDLAIEKNMQMIKLATHWVKFQSIMNKKKI
ncbi:hypothetical protein GCM10020331_082240 [Ectobacillus funiculus]